MKAKFLSVLASLLMLTAIANAHASCELVEFKRENGVKSEISRTEFTPSIAAPGIKENWKAKSPAGLTAHYLVEESNIPGGYVRVEMYSRTGAHGSASAPGSEDPKLLNGLSVELMDFGVTFECK